MYGIILPPDRSNINRGALLPLLGTDWTRLASGRLHRWDSGYFRVVFLSLGKGKGVPHSHMDF